MNAVVGGLKGQPRDLPTDYPAIEAKIRAMCNKNPGETPAGLVLNIYKELPPAK